MCLAWYYCDCDNSSASPRGCFCSGIQKYWTTFWTTLVDICTISSWKHCCIRLCRRAKYRYVTGLRYQPYDRSANINCDSTGCHHARWVFRGRRDLLEFTAPTKTLRVKNAVVAKWHRSLCVSDYTDFFFSRPQFVRGRSRRILGGVELYLYRHLYNVSCLFNPSIFEATAA